MRILGTPLGLPDFVRSQLSALSETHDELLEKVLTIQDLQCVWLLLLYCCFARANYTLRVVHPELTAGFAAHHDASLRRCLSHLLGVAPASTYSAPQCNIARKTRFLGKLGRLFGNDPPETPNRLRSHCGRPPCLAPSLPLGRGPRFWRTSGICWVPGTFLAGVGRLVLVLNSCKMSTWNLAFPAMGGSVQPQNQSMAFSLKAPSDPATEKALFRSQGVPLAGIPFLCFPTSRLSRMDSSLFHVLLLCRLWLPLPPSSRFCRCGRPLDPSGHHFGVSSETQRHPAQSLCLGRRCRFASSPQEERASVSRTLRCTWKSQTGCSRK